MIPFSPSLPVPGNHHSTFFFFFFNFIAFLFIYFIYYYYFLIFIFGCVGSSFLCEGLLQLRQVGATLHRGARASHYRGLSCCRAQAPDAQAQQLWRMGLAAPRHVGSSQARARTRVPCIGRQTLNHCATREAPPFYFLFLRVWLLYLPHLSGIIQYLSFCDWLISLSIVSSRFIHVVACDRTPFLFKSK